MWELNKSMGIGYDGDEAEVVSKIAHLEELDEAIFLNGVEEARGIG